MHFINVLQQDLFNGIDGIIIVKDIMDIDPLNCMNFKI